MEVFLIVLLGYIVPTIFASTVLLVRRRRAEKKYLNQWVQSTNLKELIINAYNEESPGQLCECSTEYACIVLAFIPFTNFYISLMFIFCGIVSAFLWICGKIPIK